MVWHCIKYPRKDVSGENMYSLLWIDDLNLSSDSTRNCSAHWDGGEKRSRTHHHLSFLGVKKNVNDEFDIGQRQPRIQEPRKEKTDISCTEMDVETESVNEVSVEQIDVDTQSNSVSPTLSFCDAETQTEITGEFLDRMEFEVKSTGEEKDKLARKTRKRRVD